MSARPLELQFLPAALEIEETPPLPMARFILWTIVVFYFIALAWACIGRVDIVGVAPGKIVPSGRTKTVQPLENAVVSAIRVAEGQHVSAGEVLIELDPTAPTADRERLAKEQLSLALEIARLQALLAAEDTRGQKSSGREPPGGATPDTAFAEFDTQVATAILTKHRARFVQQLAEYRAALAGIHEEMQEKRAARQGVDARIAQLDATIPLITEGADSHKTLMKTGMVARVKWLELERDRIEQAHERDVQRHQRASLEASLNNLAHQLEVRAAQYRGRWMDELADVETRFSSYDDELAKAKRRLALQTLTAPVSGTVQQLAVHTVGGVVTATQPLMIIVPDDGPIEVEARVQNKDIGFVREGQEAVIKVETFNFTKYGYVSGKLRKVSHDAVVDKLGALNYIAHVALDTTDMEINGEKVQLASGMAVSVEVKMGRRRVIEFLLSPLLRYQHESGRER